ncbi:MAG: COG4223 family protein [Methylocystis sp.]|uniref:COG4223 family protein n=1 Tax=Methylocystis sp. TaxID=1911079 RepID=UPI003DA3697D
MVLPNDEEPKRVESSEAPIDYTESPSEPPPPPPVRRKRRSFFGRLASTLLLLVLIAGAALYAAIAFKDRDERLKVVADYAGPYVDQASGALGGLKDRVRSLVGDGEPTQTTPISPEPPSSEPATSGAEAPPASTAPAKPAETAVEQAPLAPSTPAPNLALESQNAAIESQKAAVAALQGRVDSAEDLAQRALRAAEAAETAANAAKTSAEAAAKASPAPAAPTAPAEQGGALSANEQVTALEGRIDELGDEIKALRERLESSKGETRAAPEATAAKTPDGPAAIVVVAYALQRELEAGRPYALETKALTRLGADPAALAALAPLAEKGAPTAAQLKADFAPAAKRIHALESGASGDLAEHLLKGASKLVRVRPSGQAPTTEAQTVEEKVAHIEAALAHGDLAQASAVFAALPEAAQNDAKDFGATLRARVDAGRAADDLLHGAIAALGATKE